MAFKREETSSIPFGGCSFFLASLIYSFFKKNYVFIILFLAAHGLSVGAASRGCFLVAERGLLILEARLAGFRSCGLQ